MHFNNLFYNKLSFFAFFIIEFIFLTKTIQCELGKCYKTIQFRRLNRFSFAIIKNSLKAEF